MTVHIRLIYVGSYNNTCRSHTAPNQPYEAYVGLLDISRSPAFYRGSLGNARACPQNCDKMFSFQKPIETRQMEKPRNNRSFRQSAWTSDEDLSAYTVMVVSAFHCVFKNERGNCANICMATAAVSTLNSDGLQNRTHAGYTGD